MTHPTPSSPGKKFALSFGLIVASIGYVFSVRASGNDITITSIPTDQPITTAAVTPPQTPTAKGQPVVTTTPAPTPTSTPVATPVPVSTPAPKKGQYTDGSYIGSIADAYYGNVQVKAIVSGGKLTDVQFLQSPHTHSDSIPINRRAMPLLKQEAISAQSASVNGVSGATFTSDAFRQSLAAALTQAKA